MTAANERRAGADVAVIVNPQSGSAGDQDELRQAFADAGTTPWWLPTSADDPGTGQAEQAARGGCSTVVACGGDGTVRAVLQSVAGTDVALGIVPRGTGNLLAANLELPTGLDAVGTAVHGDVRQMDVGVVNGERFAVMAGIGFDALMVRDAPGALKQRLGSAAYVVSAVRHLASMRSKVFGASVEIDGRPSWHGRTVMVLVGNCGTVSGGLEVFPDARRDDGILDVAVLTAHGLRQWLTVGWRLLRNRPQSPRMVTRRRGASVTVHTSHPVVYELDGEVRHPTTRLDCSVEAGALRVHLPAPPSNDAEPTRDRR